MGDQVELHLRIQDDYIYSTTKYRDYFLRGRVIAPKPWTRANTVWFETNCPDVPVREIRISSIWDSKPIQGSIDQTATTVEPVVAAKTWTFTGSQQNQYTVQKQARSWTCSCPGFQFRRQCRHVEQVRKQEEELA